MLSFSCLPSCWVPLRPSCWIWLSRCTKKFGLGKSPTALHTLSWLRWAWRTALPICIGIFTISATVKKGTTAVRWPRTGPRMYLWNQSGRILATRSRKLLQNQVVRTSFKKTFSIAHTRTRSTPDQPLDSAHSGRFQAYPRIFCFSPHAFLQILSWRETLLRLSNVTTSVQKYSVVLRRSFFVALSVYQSFFFLLAEIQTCPNRSPLSRRHC